MSDIGIQYKAILEKLYTACKQYVRDLVNEIIEYGAQKSRLSTMLCREFVRVHLNPLPNQFHVDIALFREFLLWLDKKFTYYYTVDETDEKFTELKEQITQDIKDELPSLVEESVNEVIDEKIEEKLADLQQATHISMWLPFDEYDTPAIGDTRHIYIQAINNGESTTNVTLALVGLTEDSRITQGNMILVTATCTGTGNTSATATIPDTEVTASVSWNGQAQFTWSDGTTTYNLYGNNGSVAVKSGAGLLTTQINYI